MKTLLNEIGGIPNLRFYAEMVMAVSALGLVIFVIIVLWQMSIWLGIAGILVAGVAGGGFLRLTIDEQTKKNAKKSATQKEE